MSELKKNPSALVNDVQGEPVAVAPADVSDCAFERLVDFELEEIVRSRRHETPIPVILDDL
ncbi:hypothetical protein [Pseudomonas nunensis]|uniref:hypothetical protein n=1 Tax=Pseudomonas nunensis TaxID=2961896 RepID=UPI0009EB53CB|nr:hypothetical protein [Pseudomonas nunensis]